MKFEADIIMFLQAGMNDFWLYFFRVITLFGSWLGFVIALIIVFYKKKSLSYAFAGTYAVGVLVNKVLKHVIIRPRPYVAYEAILDLGGSTGYSMPSGHACSSAIIAVMVAYMAIKYGKTKATKICVPIIMTLYVALICFSRLILGQHYLTDVIAGTIEGVIFAVIGILIYNFILKKKGNKSTNGKSTKN